MFPPYLDLPDSKAQELATQKFNQPPIVVAAQVVSNQPRSRFEERYLKPDTETSQTKADNVGPENYNPTQEQILELVNSDEFVEYLLAGNLTIEERESPFVQNQYVVRVKFGDEVIQTFFILDPREVQADADGNINRDQITERAIAEVQTRVIRQLSSTEFDIRQIWNAIRSALQEADS